MRLSSQRANIEIQALQKCLPSTHRRPQQRWGLEEHLGTEQARAFRRRFLHLSFSDRIGMAPRYVSDDTLERGHVFG
jgi:hypothetical protein